jgi:hypothetical protein
MSTKTFNYMTGESGRIVCTRDKGCAGVTLMSALHRYPIARAWRGLNGEPFEVMSDIDVDVIRQIRGGAVCDCDPV